MQQLRGWCSFQPSRCRILTLFIALILVNGVSAGNKARGIAPDDLDYYKGDTIWCKDGLKSFPREHLNDNFCDCADGTDEPGTSACPNGKFYCKNLGSDPQVVYSSRVNDGICDCCDGSDEYEKRVDCPNTCGSAVSQISERWEEDAGQSIAFDTDFTTVVKLDKEPKKFGEDLVSKLKDVNYVGLLLIQWLPLFALLSLFCWMWARVPRRLPARHKKVLRPSLV